VETVTPDSLQTLIQELRERPGKAMAGSAEPKR